MYQVQTTSTTPPDTITDLAERKRLLREGIDYAKGTPLDSFIPGDTPVTWQNVYELSYAAVKGAVSPSELRIAGLLNRIVGACIGNPWAGDVSRIRRQAEARIALLAKTRSKQRDVVLAMLRAGYDVRTIARSTRLHESTVRRWQRHMRLVD